MSTPDDRLRADGKWLRRLGWLLGLWLGGVAAAALLAGALKLVLRAVT